MNTQGTVTRVLEQTKSKSGKAFRTPRYAVQINDAEWYNFGFNSPGCSEGDVISFESQKTQWGLDGDPSTVKVVDTGKRPSGTPTAKSYDPDQRQESIVFQSSLKTAIDVIDVALRNDALSLPAKKADRLDALTDMTIKVAFDLAKIAVNPSAHESAEVPVEEAADDE